MNSIELENIKNIFAPNNNEVKPYNSEYYNIFTKNITAADISSLASLKRVNYYLRDNHFINATFSGLLNNISPDQFQMILYIPDIINDIQNINYFSDATNITGLIVNDYLISNNININNILSNDILTNSIETKEIKTNIIKTKDINLDNHLFTNILGYIYINTFTLPLDKNEYLFTEFNLIPINKVYLTIYPSYTIKIYDNNNKLLYKYHNNTTKIKYMIDISHNTNFFKIKIF